jgi:hypothetical protein
MKFFSRFAALLLLILVFFSITPILPAFAQTKQTSLPNYVSSETNPDVPQNLHTLTQIVTTEVISTMICQLSGIDTMQKNHSCLGIDPQTHKIGFVNNGGGLIGLTMQGIGFTFNLPVHSGDYMAYMENNFGTEKTYAAQGAAPATIAAKYPNGIGYTGLQPLLKLWVAFRNVVYLLFVILFVFIGIAIMLRVQVDPRTVMTLENQLPKIIVGLILVTFSYVIAGGMIDLMWVLTFFAINIIAGTDPVATGLAHTATINILQWPLAYLNEVLNTTGAWGIWDLAGGAAQAVHALLTSMFTPDATKNALQTFGIGQPAPQAAGGAGCSWWVNLVPIVNAGCAIQNAGTQVGLDILQTVANALGEILSWTISGIVGLVILIAIFISMFRIWFMLLRAYIHIILEVILAPFYIAMGLVPGSSIGFGSWLRSMAANLLAFPVTVSMFVLARVLVDSFFPTGINAAVGASLFIPPLIGNPNGSGRISPLGGFIALGILFAIPEILNTVRNGLQASGIGLGTAALGNLGSGARSGGSFAKNIGGTFIDYTQGRTASVPRGMGAVMRGLFGR